MGVASGTPSWIWSVTTTIFFRKEGTLEVFSRFVQLENKEHSPAKKDEYVHIGSSKHLEAQASWLFMLKDLEITQHFPRCWREKTMAKTGTLPIIAWSVKSITRFAICADFGHINMMTFARDIKHVWEWRLFFWRAIPFNNAVRPRVPTLETARILIKFEFFQNLSVALHTGTTQKQNKMETLFH